MKLQNYYSRAQSQISISRQQASDFAKTVADDFNPIHDPDARRFCVPGDLLFALVLDCYGLHQEMQFRFASMVTQDSLLGFPDNPGPVFSIDDQKGKSCLQIERQGQRTEDKAVIHRFVRRYVEFSGHNFPHILAPLMAKHQVMINPGRPLVMYQGMSFHFSKLNCLQPELELTSTSLQADKKRANVLLEFQLKDAAQIVGKGEKHMILSGLCAYEKEKMDAMIQLYSERKQRFTDNG